MQQLALQNWTVAIRNSTPWLRIQMLSSLTLTCTSVIYVAQRQEGALHINAAGEACMLLHLASGLTLCKGSAEQCHNRHGVSLKCPHLLHR
jgi:hypothetical protein